MDFAKGRNLWSEAAANRLRGESEVSADRRRGTDLGKVSRGRMVRGLGAVA